MSENAWVTVATSIAKFVAKTAYSAGVGLYSAMVIACVWGWFIVEQFNLPAITVLQAWGLSLVLALFRTGSSVLSMLTFVEIKKAAGEDVDDFGFIFATGVFFLANILWLWAWVIHSFM